MTGRGIIIYVTKTLKADEVTINAEFQENIFIEIKLRWEKTLLVGCIYRSDSGTGENNEELLKLMRNINHNNIYLQIIIVGDFNLLGIDWTHWIPNNHRQNNLEFKFIECIRDTFLFQHILHPTRRRRTNNPSILDLILTNKDNSINDIQYMCPL